MTDLVGKKPSTEDEMEPARSELAHQAIENYDSALLRQVAGDVRNGIASVLAGQLLEAAADALDARALGFPDTSGLSIGEAVKRLDWWSYGTHQNTPEAADVRLVLLAMRDRGYIRGKDCLDFSTCDDCRGIHAKHCPAYDELGA